MKDRQLDATELTWVGSECLRLRLANDLVMPSVVFFFNFPVWLLRTFIPMTSWDLPSLDSLGVDCGEGLLSLKDWFLRLWEPSSKKMDLTDLEKLDLRLVWLGRVVSEKFLLI